MDGTADSAAQRLAAAWVMRRLKGLKGLQNQIRIEAPAKDVQAAPEAPSPVLEQPRSFAALLTPGTANAVNQVREVVGVVDSPEELDELVTQLTTHAVDRTDISLMGDLMSGVLVVFVRVDTPEEEMRALKIMREVGADNVHVQDIDVGRTREGLPLGALQPLLDEALLRAETTR